MKNPTPEHILADFPQGVRVMAGRLRKVIKKICPELSEKAYPGWHAIGWRHPQAGYIFGLFPQENAVKLYFERGADLDDPEHLLEGRQRQVRYMTFRLESEMKESQLKKMLLEAVRFSVDRKKSRKL